MPRGLPLAILLTSAAVAGCGEDQGGGPVAGRHCDAVASPETADGPATVQQLLSRLGPGEVGCLREGTYAEDDEISIATPEVTLASYPGERATIVGRVLVEEQGRGTRIEGLELDGRNSEALPSPTVNASGVVIADNDITNRNTGICVHVSDYEGVPIPAGVVIEGNRIHGCGELPATNRHHGIYLDAAREATIRDNLIYDNADRGVQLYPDADGTTVTGNVIDGNGEGLIFGGDEDDSSDDNLVTGNTITNSRVRYNVEANWPGPVGTGNLLRGNCVSGGAMDNGEGGIESPPEGFTAEDNLTAAPGYADPDAGDFRLAEDSPCLDVLDASFE